MIAKHLMNILIVALFVTITIVSANTASAAFFTTSSDIANTRDPDPLPGLGPPLPDVEFLVADSRTYTNTYGVDDQGRLRIRTIVSGVITSTGDPNHNPIRIGVNNQNNDSQLAFIAVVDGVEVAPNVVLFTSGRAGAFEDATQNHSGDNPSTWAFGSQAAPGSFAEWELTPQTAVLTDIGFGLDVPQPANITQTSSLNLLANNTEQSQGRFIFMEDSDDATQLVANAPGDGFIEIINDLTDQPGNFPDGVGNTSIGAGKVLGEGIFVTTADNTEKLSNGFAPDELGLDGADLAILNAIGLWGTTDTDDDVENPGLENNNGIEVDGVEGSGFGFATALVDEFNAAALTDFQPIFDGQTGESLTGDFRANGSPNIHPGVVVDVPEPTTAILGLMGLAGMGLRRRRNA